MPSRNAGKTITEILVTKKASIKHAPLPSGFPGWDSIADMMWEEVEQRARHSEPGFKEIRKLLSDRRFDK